MLKRVGRGCLSWSHANSKMIFDVNDKIVDCSSEQDTVINIFLNFVIAWWNIVNYYYYEKLLKLESD